MLAAAALMVVMCHVGNRPNSSEPAEAIVVEQQQEVSHCTFTSEQMANVDNVVKKKIQSGDFSGVILIGQKNNILYEQAYGLANIVENEPITDTTAFQLASVSKQFTAVAILQLYERGQLQLNDYVAQYRPGFPYPDITIHQLLVHRSVIYENPFLSGIP